MPLNRVGELPVREEARLFEWLGLLERLGPFNQRMQPFLAAKKGIIRIKKLAVLAQPR